MFVNATSQTAAPPLRCSETTEAYDRAKSRAQINEIRLQVLGALLDFPELLQDPELETALEVLEGDVALALIAVRQNFTFEKGLATDEFLAQVPGSIHSFAAGRLVSPVFEAASAAKATLLENAGKLSRQALARQNAAVVSELRNSGADAEAENALLRDVQRRARERLGLS
jgi:DNA primase